MLLDRTSIEAEQARRDFKLFLKLAWPEIEPGRPFVPGWHLDAIADHLQAVYSGDIKRLLVNMPPRHGKSSLISVLWSAWLLLNNPAIRLLCASYALNLAIRDNVKARRLIKKPWFQTRYGHIFSLAKDQDAKIKFETNQLGYRMVTSVDSATTGEGGDILILDDPHNIQEKSSDPKREAALDWFDNTWSSRLNDQQTGQMVVVGHRIHFQDVSGHILESNDGEWVHLNLPAEFEAGNRCRTVFLPSLGKVWQDPRTEESQLLWPARFPERVIEKAKNRHLSGYAALYQQRPVPAGGGQFKEKWFRYASVENGFYVLETPEGPRRVAIKDCWRFSVIDLAISTKQSADYTVIQTYDVTPQNDLILIDQIRGHFDNPEQVKIIRATYFRLRPQFFQIESVAYQLAIIQQLRDEPVEQVDLPDLDVQVGDFLVRGSDPAALDATLRAFEQGFKAFVVKTGDDYARYANACVVRVQGDIYFFKFAMEQQRYGEIVGEIRKEDIERMEAERRRKYSIPIREYKPVRDKVSRASAPAWLMEQGKFYFLKTLPDLPLIKVEHLTFPKGAHDDMVDCSSQAAEVIFGPSGPLVWSPDDYDPIPALPVIAQPENHNLLEIDWNPPVPAAWDFSEGETVDLEIGGRWS